MKHLGGLSVGLVVIGRNEGRRLAHCLVSVRATGAPAVYVDSNSSDGSVGVAGHFGIPAIGLTAGPYTAARGRQTGLESLLDSNPDLELVQFIDGDCVLDAGWMAVAAAALTSDVKVAAVCGRRREARTAASSWSRLIDVDWNIPAGEVAYFGGDVLCRVSALASVGGWDRDLIAGEEPDLSFRLRDAGYRIVRLPVAQTEHDMAITHFRQFWKRALRGGYASLQVGWRHRSGVGRRFMREASSGIAYGLVLPLVTIVCAVIHPLLALVPIALWCRVWLAMAKYARSRSAAPMDCLRYATAGLATKPAAGWGAMMAAVDLLRNRRQSLIEYKAPVEAEAAS